MFRASFLAGVSLTAAIASQTARAQYSPGFVTPPYMYQPDAGPQLGGPPYQGRGFTIYPPASSSLPPQLTNPAANPYPSGAQTCVATPYTCRASAPNTPGNACTCPTKEGRLIEGVVH